MNDYYEEVLFDLVDELFVYYKDDNWLTVKKYLVRYSHPDIRKLFSTRHPKTKKHKLNDAEKYLINKIKVKYNRELKLYEKDKHK